MTDLKKTLAENRKHLENSEPMPSPQTMTMMLDPGYQRGIAWRMDKIHAILECKQIGKTETWIMEVLLRSGITPTKARELIQTSERILEMNATTGYQEPERKDFRE